jgi:hypothetical protein
LRIPIYQKERNALFLFVFSMVKTDCQYPQQKMERINPSSLTGVKKPVF